MRRASRFAGDAAGSRLNPSKAAKALAGSAWALALTALLGAGCELGPEDAYDDLEWGSEAAHEADRTEWDQTRSELEFGALPPAAAPVVLASPNLHGADHDTAPEQTHTPSRPINERAPSGAPSHGDPHPWSPIDPSHGDPHPWHTPAVGDE